MTSSLFQESRKLNDSLEITNLLFSRWEGRKLTSWIHSMILEGFRCKCWWWSPPIFFERSPTWASSFCGGRGLLSRLQLLHARAGWRILLGAIGRLLWTWPTPIICAFLAPRNSWSCSCHVVQIWASSGFCRYIFRLGMLSGVNAWLVFALPDAILRRNVMLTGLLWWEVSAYPLFLLLIEIVKHWYVFVVVSIIIVLLTGIVNGGIWAPRWLLLKVRRQSWASRCWCSLARLWSSLRAVFPGLKSCLHKWSHYPELWISIINLNPEKAIQSQGMIVANPFHNLIFRIKTLIEYIWWYSALLIFLWSSTG